jgi:hypothetical protein
MKRQSKSVLIRKLDSTSSKAEELAVLAKMAEAAGTGSYLSSFFSVAMIADVENRIRQDLSADVHESLDYWAKKAGEQHNETIALGAELNAVKRDKHEDEVSTAARIGSLMHEAEVQETRRKETEAAQAAVINLLNRELDEAKAVIHYKDVSINALRSNLEVVHGRVNDLQTSARKWRRVAVAARQVAGVYCGAMFDLLELAQSAWAVKRMLKPEEIRDLIEPYLEQKEVTE